MAYINTGVERCQTVRIDKKINNVSVSGYPKDYSILSAFTANGNSYSLITETDFQRMSEVNYLQRLSDFKDYVESVEEITSIDDITETGYEAYRTNTTSCPIGE